MDLTNNEIENINERHTKLRNEHEKLKSEVETQNKYNADNQESVDKALKKLNEEKNVINSDIDMIRNDIRTNENSRKNQDNVFNNKLEQLKQKQIGESPPGLFYEACQQFCSNSNYLQSMERQS